MENGIGLKCMADLTPKQEIFCLRYIETGNATEAYRLSYDAENMADKTIWEEASRLKADPKVSARLEQLQSLHRQRHMVTVDSITAELDELKRDAHAEKQFSPAITAVMGKAKIHGLLVDKSELTGKDGGPIETKETDSMDAARKIAFVLAKAAIQSENSSGAQ